MAKKKKTKEQKKIVNNVKFNEVSNPEWNDFVKICKMTEMELKSFLKRFLKCADYNPLEGDGWLYAKGDIPILLTAHMDTVHTKIVKNYIEFTNSNGNHILVSNQGIGGDDRCGIFIIMQMLERGLRPYILFCEDEESGGVGSDKFLETETAKELFELAYMIELDRKNSHDAVYYDCDNPDFTEYITKITGYKEAYGSFSDISNLAPFAGIAAVNLSCGYYHPHSTQEEVNMEEMYHTIDVVEKLLKETPQEFDYIPTEYGISCGYYGGYSGEWCGENVVLDILYAKPSGEIEEVWAEGWCEEEAWKNFFFENPDVCFNDVHDWYVC